MTICFTSPLESLQSGSLNKPYLYTLIQFITTFEEKFCEFSKQEVLVLLQTPFAVAICRLGMCVCRIGNYAGAPLMHKLHHEKCIRRKHAQRAQPDLYDGRGHVCIGCRSYAV